MKADDRDLTQLESKVDRHIEVCLRAALFTTNVPVDFPGLAVKLFFLLILL